MDAKRAGWNHEKGGKIGDVDRLSLVISLGFLPLRVFEYVIRTEDQDFERGLLKLSDNLLFWQLSWIL